LARSVKNSAHPDKTFSAILLNSWDALNQSRLSSTSPFVCRQRPPVGPFLEHRMEWSPEAVVDLIFDNGPFSKELVESWPYDLQKDYLELMKLDLQELGMDEFRRKARFLGETYLLSHEIPISLSPVLMEAWTLLTGGESPPEMPIFNIV
jgi:hypothetical protein